MSDNIFIEIIRPIIYNYINYEIENSELYFEDIYEWIEYAFNNDETDLSIEKCENLLYELDVNSPVRTYYIFKYVSDHLAKYDLPDLEKFEDKINKFRYIMALEWYEDNKEEQNIYIDDSISLVITDIPLPEVI